MLFVGLNVTLTPDSVTAASKSALTECFIAAALSVFDPGKLEHTTTQRTILLNKTGSPLALFWLHSV